MADVSGVILLPSDVRRLNKQNLTCQSGRTSILKKMKDAGHLYISNRGVAVAAKKTPTDNSVLRSKLQSKVEALAIMSKQLDKCSIDKDRYKVLAEQFQMRFPSSRGPEADYKQLYNGLNNVSGAQLLANTREQNKLLSIEVETLRNKLEEAEEDIRVLRKQKKSPQPSLDKAHDSTAVSVLNFEREELVRQLETLNKKVEQLQSDLRSMLDEKEDLINERDAYKCKLHRLNHQLMVALSKKTKTNGVDSVKSGPVLDIDSLIMENRYLQERLTQAIAENELASHALTKYKSILETKHRKGVIKLGTNTANAVVTHKQVKHLLESGTTQELPINAATIADLRALSFGLLDALNDKSLALSHQKKANRILATRITELEKRLEGTSDNEERVSLFPSKVFLETYCSSEVDTYEINNQGSEKNDADVLPKDLDGPPKINHDTKSNEMEVDLKVIQTKRSKRKKDMAEDHKNTVNGVVIKSELCIEKTDLENDEESLPPELQKLVQEALDNIYIEESQNQ